MWPVLWKDSESGKCACAAADSQDSVQMTSQVTVYCMNAPDLVALSIAAVFGVLVGRMGGKFLLKIFEKRYGGRNFKEGSINEAKNVGDHKAQNNLQGAEDSLKPNAYMATSSDVHIQECFKDD